MNTLRAMPILQVRDVAMSADFYARLGFSCHGFWGDPPGFAIVQRGDVTIGLYRPDNATITPNEYWAAYVYVDNVDALHAEFAALNLPEQTPLCDQEYGCRDFDVVDIDGHRIAFGQDMQPDGFGPGKGPDRGNG